MPGVYREEELDFAGTCVGIVERDRVIDGSRVEAGDVVLGLPSSGLHTNGYSLVRGLLGDEDFDADLLLAQHRLYLGEVRDLRAKADVTGTAVRDRVFSEAGGEFVLCMDCHVLFAPGSLKKLIDYFRTEPESRDLVQGPLIYDDLAKISTHWADGWRAGMYGQWANDPAGSDPGAAR